MTHPMTRAKPGHDPEPILFDPPRGNRTWVTAWYTDPPPAPAIFKVLPGGDEWHETEWPGYEGLVPCRHIHRIQIVEGD